MDIITNAIKPGGDKNTVHAVIQIIKEKYPSEQFNFEKNLNDPNLDPDKSIAVLTINNIKDPDEKKHLEHIAKFYKNSKAPIIISTNRVEKKTLNSEPIKSLINRPNTIIQTLDINRGEMDPKLKAKTIFTPILPVTKSPESMVQNLHQASQPLRNLNTVMLPGLVNDKKQNEAKDIAKMKSQLTRLAKSLAEQYKKTDEKISVGLNPNRTPPELKDFFNQELVKQGIKAENIEDLSSSKVEYIQARSKEIFLPNESVRMISEFSADHQMKVNVVNYYNDKFYKRFSDSLPVKQISFPRKFLFFGANTKVKEAEIPSIGDSKTIINKGFDNLGLSSYVSKTHSLEVNSVTQNKSMFSWLRNPFAQRAHLATFT
ncbi:MAG: hypothetical protein HRT47_04025 [Candidatus Caenarcaniphilales bacterium]|nr:hypothetical protein [Candidatus Caenarcaniphilales bacterium]